MSFVWEVLAALGTLGLIVASYVLVYRYGVSVGTCRGLEESRQAFAAAHRDFMELAAMYQELRNEMTWMSRRRAFEILSRDHEN